MKATVNARFDRGRLRYAPIFPQDAAALEPVLLDDRVWPRLQDAGLPKPTAADIHAMAESKHGHWEEHGFGYWLLSDPVTNEVIGRGGLQYTRVTGTPEVEIGWAIAPWRWGEGLATELARVAIEEAFGSLALETVIAYTQLDNRASQRVMEKAGLHADGEVERAGLPHALYRLDRRDR